MKRFALIISIFSLTYAQYDIYNLNNYNYGQDSLRTINLTHVAKSFIVPGWGQLSNKDPLWKPILFFGIESIAIGSNLHFTKKSNNYKGDFEIIKKISMEDVLSIKGTVRSRLESAINPNLATGDIEILVSEFIMLNESAPLPFMLNNTFFSN